MKNLVNFETNSEFESAKTELDNFYDYAALTEDDDNVHFKEIPDMVDIALWDNADEKLFMIRGWEYDTNVYPTDRYTPIGVEVIPRSHMDDGHARIMSLRYMVSSNPLIGSINSHVIFGLNYVDINGMSYKSYFPCINEQGTLNFGVEQEIKYFESNESNLKFPSDLYNEPLNPFTKNQGYKTAQLNSGLLPSPYLENMLSNPLFFTENPVENNPSALLNFDGKGETAKILNQLAINLGNEDWKTGTTILSTTSETLGWDKIAPAAQCCWMYCVDKKYKDNPIFGQGQWYLPTVGELCYLIARINAINNTIIQLNYKSNIYAPLRDNHMYISSSSRNMTTLISPQQNNGTIISKRRIDVAHGKAFLLI